MTTQGDSSEQLTSPLRGHLSENQMSTYLIIGIHALWNDVGILLVALVSVVVLAAYAFQTRSRRGDPHSRVEMRVLPPVTTSTSDS